jgi:diguanylate cyclase (GGDEF)-like protein
MAKTGMIIDGVMGSQCIDSSGEVLDVDGADISDLEEGRGVLNYEHKGAEDKDSNGQEIVGKIITAKKIFKEADCDNTRERAYWQKVKHPFIYGVCRLYDGAGHEGAKALAAQIRDHHANSEPILVRFSVEGSTLEKEGNVLKRSVIRRVALTLKPCNRTADSGLVEDPNAPRGFDKKPVQRVNDILVGLTDDAKKMEHEHPLYQKLGGSHELEYMEFDDDGRKTLIKALVKLKIIKRKIGNRNQPPVAPTKWHQDEPEDATEAAIWHGDNADKNLEYTREYIPVAHIGKWNAQDAASWLKEEADGRENPHYYDDLEAAYKANPEHLPVIAAEGKEYTESVNSDGNRYGLDDGAHRLAIAYKLGMTHVPAFVGRPRTQFKKALSAGGGDVAPSQLSGGAALQREDLVRFKTKAMKTLKSFLDKNFEFTRSQILDTLKQELPEASDEFLGHFANIAEDYKLKLRKNDEGDSYPKLNPKLPGVQEVRVDRSAEPKGELPPVQAGSMEMKPGGKFLIQRSGTKGRPRVGLQQHFPNDALYHALLKPDEGLSAGTIDQDTHALIVKTVHEPWHRAMSNWMPLNAALAKGKVPNGILAKATIFAAMSPNTSVPNQERYYGHYMDMLNEGKVDPFKPVSDDAIKEFTARSTSGEDPIWNREYYQAHPRIGIGDYEAGQSENDLPQIMGIRNSHMMFPYLQHLTARHKDDTQGIAAELMDLKAEHRRYDDAHRTARYLDKKFTKPLLEHPHIKGYGPKLTRYLLGMMGGGNMIVPDRHMIRSTFDLHLEQNTDILDKLQTQIVTHPRNEKLLRAIDHNFFVHHPAVKQVLETFPKHFQGREQQAIFPAFWLHWLTIGHYDRMRGRPSMAFNTDTDHAVFWDSVRDEMIKHGLNPHPMIEGRVVDDPQGTEDESFNFGENLGKGEVNPWPRHHAVNDQPVWLKAAGVTSALRQRWGETPAMVAFFSHVMPVLMAGETPVPPVTHRPHMAYNPDLLRAEALLIDLKKAVADGTGEHPAFAELAPEIHHVYMLKPGPDMKIRRHPAGRFTTAGGHVSILEDYHDALKNGLTEGPIDAGRQQQIQNLYNHPRYDVATLDSIRNGSRPELWDFVSRPTPTKPIASFDFHRIGAHPDDPQFQQEKPDHLVFMGGEAYLNGHQLDHKQTQALLQHVNNGHAIVRYRKDNAGAIRKMESVFDDLFKVENPQAATVHEALGRLDQLVASGHLESHHAEALRQHAFKDPMTGHQMGNKFAHEDFKNRSASKGGIHLAMDANDFKSINDKYGHETGDTAIKALGSAMRGAMDEAAPGEGKLFRIGGDEFAAHVPTHEHAARFARALRHRLESITPIQGTHKLSMGIGIGISPESADAALFESKKQKYDPAGMTHPDSRKWVSKYAPGAAPSFAHSLVPGFEGPVPLDQSQLQIQPPPMPAPRPEEPAPVVHTPSAPAQNPVVGAA